MNIEEEAPEVESERGDAAPGAAPLAARRPYQAPRVDSGEAFERVQLTSLCGFGDPLDPECVPC